MLIVKVKICGITNHDDAVAAMNMGADIIGFNFYPGSPRYLIAEEAAKNIGKLPALVDTAGIFVNASLDEIRRTIDVCLLDWVQLHGDESPEFCDSVNSTGVKTMKAIRVKDKARPGEKPLEFWWHGPLTDIVGPKSCPGSGEPMEASWEYCPWNGRKVP